LAGFPGALSMAHTTRPRRVAWESVFRGMVPNVPTHEVKNRLIVGGGDIAQRVAAFIQERPECGRSFCRFLDDDCPRPLTVLGSIRDLAQLARAEFVDEVILAAPRNRESALRVVHEARKLRLDVQVVPDLYGCESKNRVEDFAGLPVLCLHKEQLPRAGL